MCSLYLLRPLWCVASSPAKTKRRITILLFLDGNNIFWSKQPEMLTNTYFPVSPQPQITPEPFSAGSRLHAVMIYSGRDFLTSGQRLSRCRADSHPEVSNLTSGVTSSQDRMSRHASCVRRAQAGLSLPANVVDTEHAPQRNGKHRHELLCWCVTLKRRDYMLARQS